MASGIQIRTFGSANQEDLPDQSSTIIIVLLSIALYNVLELVCIIWGTFRRYAGLYFWSFLVATLGVALSCVGFFIKFFGSQSLGYFSCTLSLIGWVCMVTGQSLVLWSRLHLLMRDPRRLRIILCIIITNAIVCHGAVIPMVYGSFSSNPEVWQKPYEIAEKIEVVIFFLQEFMLSAFYIVETVELMKVERVLGSKRSSRKLMKHLIIVNILVIVLDITILSLEFANLYNYQISYKPFAYSVKLKLEFTVLNRLVDLVTSTRELSSSQRSREYSGPNNTSNNTSNNNSIGLKTLSDETGNSAIGASYNTTPAMVDIERRHTKKSLSSTQTNDGIMVTTGTSVHISERQDLDSENIYGALSVGTQSRVISSKC